MLKKNTSISVTLMLLVFFVFGIIGSHAVIGKTPVVVINPGHVIGYDPGAVNATTGAQEAYVNAQVAKYTANELQQKGYKVYLSHPVAGCNVESILTASQANSLVNLFKVNNVNPDLVISIHHNSSSNPNASGYEFYWSSYRDFDKEGVYEVSGLWGNGEMAFRDRTPSPEAANSKVFADLLRQNFTGNGLNYNKTVERDDYLPAHAKAPCVLIEGGYISNYWESYRLYTEDYQKDTASRIVKSVEQFLKYKAPVTVPSAKKIEMGLKDSAISVSATHRQSETYAYQTVFAIWHESNPSNQFWTNGQYEGNGKHSSRVNLDYFGRKNGQYFVDVYCYDPNGKSYYLGQSSLTVVLSKPEYSSFSVKAAEKSLNIRASFKDKGLKDREGIFVIYNTKNPSDQYWYSARSDQQASFNIDFKLDYFGFKAGTYHIDSYGYDTFGQSYYLGSCETSYGFSPKAQNIKMKLENRKLTISAEHAVSAFRNEPMIFAVYNTRNPSQQYWAYGNAVKTGVYELSMDIGFFSNSEGTFRVDIYCYDDQGRSYCLGNKEIKAETQVPKAKNIQVSVNSKTLNAQATHVYSTMNDLKMIFAVYNEKNPAKQFWGYGNSDGNGKYSVNIDLSYFNQQKGRYCVEIYCYDRNGRSHCLGTASAELEAEYPQAKKIDFKIENDQIIASAEHEFESMNDLKMIFAVYNENNPSNQFWGYGSTTGNGVYNLNLGLNYFGSQEGTYRADIYCYDKKGKSYCLGTRRAEYKKMTSVKPAVQNVEMTISNGRIRVQAEHVYDSMNDYKMVFAVYNRNNSEQQYWAYGSSNGDGRYELDIALSYFADLPGIYRTDIYCYDHSGRSYHLSTIEKEYIKKVETTGYSDSTSIMGMTNVTAEQLVNEYTKNSPGSFPQYYTAQGISLEKFVNIYLEESQAEGVRGEIAFTQMLLETGYLQFGGDVKVEQYNFAGLGATGGVPGNSFSDLRTGVRAHIQHLKCYASDQPLNNPCVDQRWGDWLRLKAPTIGKLSGTWAADRNYSQKIVTILNRL